MSERERYWRGVLRQWQASGMNRAAFCRLRDISYHTLSRWKGRIDAGRGDDAPRKRPPFVEVQVPAEACSTSHSSMGHSSSGVECTGAYEIALAGGRLLRIPPGFDDRDVARLIAVVESC